MSTLKIQEKKFPDSVLKPPKPKYLKPKIRPNILILNGLDDSKEPSISEETDYSKNIKRQNIAIKEKIVSNC